eukprot:TRINITY_DN8214_c0_g1_i3.p1 TRINITY_DN8214_c0_g1~~TRINITY_DN8214_c0_g1_i3.p1  ORF type:complete len:181 (+),score=60.95 TRINITY_DN8214_c0_g1_i3:66-545(+)
MPQVPYPHVGKLKIKSTAFMVCDIQERFRSLIQFMPSVVFVARKMVRAAKIFDLPLIVTEQYPQVLGKTVPEIGLSKEQKVIEKFQFSMLLPEVEEELKRSNIKSVVLMGIEAHVCVMQTTLDLLEKGYDVHIVADGTSSSSNDFKNLPLSECNKVAPF